jgi:alkylation response protein AidB-like acyl-CoA dehydrogenase
MAEASSQLDAVQALIARDLKATQDAIRAGEVSVDQRVQNRRDDAFAVRVCVQIMATIYEFCGTDVMFPPHPLERTWRDVNAAAKHVGLSWDNMATMAGRHLLGLEPRGQY